MKVDGIPGGASSVTPANTGPNAFAGLYVGVTGNVALVTEEGDAITFVGVPAGSILPIRTKQIKSTGTTAASIIGFRK
jgi:hypothetical protein